MIRKIFIFASVLLLLSLPAFAQTKRRPNPKNDSTAKSPPPVDKLRIAMDYDNDGKADFAVFNHATNKWNIAKSNGGTISQQFGIRGQDYFVPGDYDGDSIGDLAVFRDSEHKWYIMYSSTSALVTIDFGASGDEPVARDYDGDGKTDLAVARKNFSTNVTAWIIRKSSANPVTTANVTEATDWGLAADSTCPGDYDADGKFDLCVRRAAATDTGLTTFITKLSSTGLQESVAWGLNGDLIIAGDYDGDFKTDYAVLREGKLQTDPLKWLIRRSSDTTAVVVDLGITGTSYNAQNDYDGDNRTDLAVWDNSTATFTIINALTMTSSSFAWGVVNDYPIASYQTR
jgi:hypothetical protein